MILEISLFIVILILSFFVSKYYIRFSASQKDYENITIQNDKLEKDWLSCQDSLKNCVNANKNTSKITLPTPWICGVKGIYAPIRLNKDKKIECMSNDGTCKIRENINQCQQDVDSYGSAYNNHYLCSDDSKEIYCPSITSIYGLIS